MLRIVILQQFALPKTCPDSSGAFQLHSNQMWKDLREFYKLEELFKMLKINDF